MPGNAGMLADLFNTCVGRFWSIEKTWDYMEARFALVEALLKIKTFRAVDAALGHATDMLRLNRSDKLGMRDLAPSLMLRLNMDQECYDFLIWWGIEGRRTNYDWGNVDLPYQDVRDADAFEPMEFSTGNFPEFSHCIAATLLKIKLCLELIAVDHSEAVGERVPQEILDAI